MPYRVLNFDVEIRGCVYAGNTSNETIIQVYQLIRFFFEKALTKCNGQHPRCLLIMPRRGHGAHVCNQSE